jgi:hypothetical protein
MEIDMNKTILVWRFEDAPKEYQELSDHGGDEDWVAFVPEYMKDYWIGWLESGSYFGCASVSEHEVAGDIIRIGAHA